MDDSAALGLLIDALRPWLDELVIVGGWAHQLHRLHPLADVPPYRPLRTRDADLAFASNAKLAGNMGAALKAANFSEDLSTEHSPPVAQYRLGEEHQGFYAEFLAPLIGSANKRGGAPDATLAKAGITAQKLRYLEILLTAPWTVRLGDTSGIPLARPADVKVANPVSFIVQKVLIHKDRKPDKKPQDVLYVHDTLDLFGQELDALRVQWHERVSPTLAPNTTRNVDRLWREQFGAVNDVMRAAARIPQDRSLTPERLQLACAHGLEQVLGGSA